MIFQQFYLESLGHASYLVGSEDTGEAFVLDVRRDVEQYYRYAQQQGLKISYAADTHQHNDYLTGITELSQRGPLELLASARAELGYRARSLTDGMRLSMGEVEFEVLHTPGHTPEHISFLVRDKARGDDPLMLFSGGALLVNDVARPDLLGSDADKKHSAHLLCQTLREKILTLPDHVLVYPTHVAGSLCGGNIGAMLVTTIGYERRLNQILRTAEDMPAFETQCINMRALPTVPPYWRRMRGQNQAGPAPLGVLTEPQALTVDAFESRLKDGAPLLDCRSPEAFGGGHIPGAINVGAGSAFPTWAGSVLPENTPLLLVLERADELWEVVWNLLRIGYDIPLGWLAGGMAAWRTAGRALAFMPQWTVWELNARQQSERDLVVLDVRQPGEWQAGHVPGAVHISGGTLPGRLDEVPKDHPIAVYCGSGYRSSVAASLLKHVGRNPVFNVMGGFSAWQSANLPVEK